MQRTQQIITNYAQYALRNIKLDNHILFIMQTDLLHKITQNYNSEGHLHI